MQCVSSPSFLAIVPVFLFRRLPVYVLEMLFPFVRKPKPLKKRGELTFSHIRWPITTHNSTRPGHVLRNSTSQNFRDKCNHNQVIESPPRWHLIRVVSLETCGTKSGYRREQACIGMRAVLDMSGGRSGRKRRTARSGLFLSW